MLTDTLQFEWFDFKNYHVVKSASKIESKNPNMLQVTNGIENQK